MKCQACHRKTPCYNYPGMGTPIYCVDCKHTDMVDIVHQLCPHGKQKCWECSPIDLLRHVCRHRIRVVLPQCENPDIYLGADYQTIYLYLCGLMDKTMTCSNYGAHKGQWSLDHIIPIGFGCPDLDAKIKRLHYKNIRPIYGNSKKGACLRQEDIDFLVKNKLWNPQRNDFQIPKITLTLRQEVIGDKVLQIRGKQ